MIAAQVLFAVGVALATPDSGDLVVKFDSENASVIVHDGSGSPVRLASVRVYQVGESEPSSAEMQFCFAGEPSLVLVNSSGERSSVTDPSGQLFIRQGQQVGPWIVVRVTNVRGHRDYCEAWDIRVKNSNIAQLEKSENRIGIADQTLSRCEQSPLLYEGCDCSTSELPTYSAPCDAFIAPVCGSDWSLFGPCDCLGFAKNR